MLTKQDKERITDRLIAYRWAPVRAPTGAGQEERRHYAMNSAVSTVIFGGLTAFMVSDKCMDVYKVMTDGDYSQDGLVKKGIVAGLTLLMVGGTAMHAYNTIADLVGRD